MRELGKRGARDVRQGPDCEPLPRTEPPPTLARPTKISGSLALTSLNLTRRDILPTLTATLTIIALDNSSLQRFEAST